MKNKTTILLLSVIFVVVAFLAFVLSKFTPPSNIKLNQKNSFEYQVTQTEEVSKSSDLDTIEEEIETTDLDSLDSELDQIDKEL